MEDGSGNRVGGVCGDRVPRAHKARRLHPIGDHRLALEMRTAAVAALLIQDKSRSSQRDEGETRSPKRTRADSTKGFCCTRQAIRSDHGGSRDGRDLKSCLRCRTLTWHTSFRALHPRTPARRFPEIRFHCRRSHRSAASERVARSVAKIGRSESVGAVLSPSGGLRTTDRTNISADFTLRPSELAATLACLVEHRQPTII